VTRASVRASPTKNNPLFTGGGLVYDGVIYLEIPEITQRLLLSGVGASSIDVEPVFLLGQSALGYVMGQMPRPTRRDETDYDFIKGIGIEAQYGVGKIAKAPLSVGSAPRSAILSIGAWSRASSPASRTPNPPPNWPPSGGLFLFPYHRRA
jgi:hypothetical protein